MRVLVFVILVLTAVGACVRRGSVVQHRVTGTCDGACDYYTACKRTEDQRTYHACVSECSDFFADRQALRELERLDCEELVAFIEGPSGTAPGQ